MTTLLDTPPEIFTRIIAIVVADVGIDAAWKARRVCKSFAAYIRDEVFLNRPMSDFDNGRKSGSALNSIPCKLFCHNIDRFLLCRLRKHLDVHPSLPMAIAQAADYVAAVESVGFQTERSAIEIRLCRAAAAERSVHTIWQTLRTGVKPWAKRRSEMSRQGASGSVPHMTPQECAMADRVVGATLVGNFDAVRACLDNGAQLWMFSYVFGYSLTAAVTHCERPDMLPLLLDSLPRRMTQKMTGMKQIERMFTDVVFTLLKKNEHGTLLYVLHFAARNLPTISKHLFNSWLNEAVASQVSTIVEAVLKVRTKGCSTLKVTTEQFFRALSIGDIPTISALIRKGNVNVNRTYHGSSALNEAIIHRDGNVVRALLQHGANPDGPEELITYKDQPLFNAIKDRCWGVVDLLLEYGATLAGHHGDANSLLKQLEEWSASSCHDVEPGFRDSRVIVHGIYKRLRAAKERHHADAFLSSATKDYKGHALPFVA